MRIEIHAALWVAAGVAMGLAIWHGATRAAYLSSWEDEVRAAQPQVPRLEIAGLGNQGRETVPPVVTVAPKNGRTLFTINDAARPAPVPMQAVEQPVPKPTPVLRGIVSEGARVRAVFESSTTAPDYVVVGVGDEVGGYRVLAIDPDSLAVENGDGARQTLKLRGAGELP